MIPPSMFLLVLLSFLPLHTLGHPAPDPNCGSDISPTISTVDVASTNISPLDDSYISMNSGNNEADDEMIYSRSNTENSGGQSCQLPLRYRYPKCNEEDTKKWEEEFDSCMRTDHEAVDYQCKKAACLAVGCLPEGEG